MHKHEFTCISMITIKVSCLNEKFSYARNSYVPALHVFVFLVESRQQNVLPMLGVRKSNLGSFIFYSDYIQKM